MSESTAFPELPEAPPERKESWPPIGAAPPHPPAPTIDPMRYLIRARVEPGQEAAPLLVLREAVQDSGK